MRLFLALSALVLPMARAASQPVYVNSTEIGQCFSPYVYNLILNAAYSGAAVFESAVKNRTVCIDGVCANTSSTGSGIDEGDFRIELETGNKVMTIITLFVIGAISLFLLIAGEALVNSMTVMVSALVSFMGFLYLWQWACSSTVSPMAGFVKCILPFILACLCALLIAIAIAMLIKKFTSLVFFIMGAGGGAVGMFLLRQFIIAGNPGLTSNVWFNFYWLGLAVVALVCGLVAICAKRAIVTIVTCILGGYGFAVALCGLIPAFGGPYVANYVFFIVAGVAMVLGAIFQCVFCKPDPEKKARAEQYKLDQEARKKQTAQQQGQGVQFIAP